MCVLARKVWSPGSCGLWSSNISSLYLSPEQVQGLAPGERSASSRPLHIRSSNRA